MPFSEIFDQMLHERGHIENHLELNLSLTGFQRTCSKVKPKHTHKKYNKNIKDKKVKPKHIHNKEKEKL